MATPEYKPYESPYMLKAVHLAALAEKEREMEANISDLLIAKNEQTVALREENDRLREGLEGIKEEHDSLQRANWDYIMPFVLDALRGEVIEDGFGSSWSAYCAQCGEKTMQIVRPGKVQCAKCG